MPELPEVETTLLGLAPHLGGRQILNRSKELWRRSFGLKRQGSVQSKRFVPQQVMPPTPSG